MKPILKSRLSKRLKIIEGQVRGLEKMLEDDTYCMDIIVQSTAVIKALASFEDAVLKNHLDTHIIEQVKAGKQNQAIAEIMKVYRLAAR
ncbi:MAG: metal-sensitive transcriptional regulator [Candidatus Magasanikbacteria bacterium]|nr:metal-sensitive transcriptional regulator [Candidatus Magasanikbacteria bacterium]